MFLFLLITAELAILYTVYWYLFTRDPKQARRISAENWGSYNVQGTTDGGAPNAIKQFMVPAKEEMILDLRTNHYVPLPAQKSNWYSSLLRLLDDCLSELNVKA